MTDLPFANGSTPAVACRSSSKKREEKLVGRPGLLAGGKKKKGGGAHRGGHRGGRGERRAFISAASLRAHDSTHVRYLQLSNFEWLGQARSRRAGEQLAGVHRNPVSRLGGSMSRSKETSSPQKGRRPFVLASPADFVTRTKGMAPSLSFFLSVAPGRLGIHHVSIFQLMIVPTGRARTRPGPSKGARAQASRAGNPN